MLPVMRLFAFTGLTAIGVSFCAVWSLLTLTTYGLLRSAVVVAKSEGRSQAKSKAPRMQTRRM
ncbi:MAG: hypothetical protein ACXWLM_11295 [Myxococcales bacterium]